MRVELFLFWRWWGDGDSQQWEQHQAGTYHVGHTGTVAPKHCEVEENITLFNGYIHTHTHTHSFSLGCTQTQVHVCTLAITQLCEAVVIIIIMVVKCKLEKEYTNHTPLKSFKFCPLALLASNCKMDKLMWPQPTCINFATFWEKR